NAVGCGGGGGVSVFDHAAHRLAVDAGVCAAAGNRRRGDFDRRVFERIGLERDVLHRRGESGVVHHGDGGGDAASAGDDAIVDEAAGGRIGGSELRGDDGADREDRGGADRRGAAARLPEACVSGGADQSSVGAGHRRGAGGDALHDAGGGLAHG